MPNCFIIMPITTPEQYVNIYGGDRDHFIHVLEHLFTPALAKINYTPIPPMAEGSDIIHAGIIKQLETADLVLCDMSTLNANVFFELGIRTAVDKPACIVKDRLTQLVPFDTSIINYHIYDPSLAPWTLNNEIERLSQHLLKTINSSENRNTLWKYFGLTTRAKFSEGESSLEAKVDFLSLQIEALQQQSKENVPPRIDKISSEPHNESETQKLIIENAQQLASPLKAKIISWRLEEPNKIIIDLGGFWLTRRVISQIVDLGKPYGYEVELINVNIQK